MSTETTQVSALDGAYLVNGTVGNVGVPGAPIMHFSLIVVPGSGSASGTVTITQAIPPPNGYIVIRNVTGTVRELVFGPTVTKVVTLQGSYVQPFGPPPLIGVIEQKFSAHLAVDNSWTGRGSFSYGGHNVENVPVKSSR